MTGLQAGSDVTDLSAYRQSAGTPPPSAQSASATSRSSTSRADAYHLSESDMALTVLFGSRSITDPYSGPTQQIYMPARGGGEEVPHAAQVRSLIPPAVDSPMSLLDALQFFYDSTPETRAYVQAALYNRGLMPKKWNRFGESDEASFNAWKKALIRSARTGDTIWQTLTGKRITMTQFFDGTGEGGNQVKLAASSFATAGAIGGRRQPLSVRYSNPADLKAHATLAAQEALGYVPDEDFLNDFVRLYHGMEQDSQRKAYAGGNYTDPGNPQVQAAELARKEHPVEAEAHSVAKTFESLMSIIGVGGA